MDVMTGAVWIVFLVFVLPTFLICATLLVLVFTGKVKLDE